MSAESLPLREAQAMLTLAEVMRFMADELGSESGFGTQLGEIAPELVERGRDRRRGPSGRPELTVVD